MRRFNAEQRDKILVSAIEVFAEKGLKGATIRAVAKSAGFNSALIYYYFENKQTLFIESIKHILRGFFAQLERDIKQFSTAEERVGFLVDGIFRYYTTNPERMRLMSVVLVMHGDLMRKIIRQFLRERSALPLQIIMEGVMKQQLKKFNPVQVWWTILGASMLSLRMHQVVDKNRAAIGNFKFPDIDETRAQIFEMLCYGIKNPQVEKE